VGTGIDIDMPMFTATFSQQLKGGNNLCLYKQMNVEKQNAVNAHNGILFSHKKE
jgi:hypothetical protein